MGVIILFFISRRNGHVEMDSVSVPGPYPPDDASAALSGRRVLGALRANAAPALGQKAGSVRDGTPLGTHVVPSGSSFLQATRLFFLYFFFSMNIC